MTMKDLASVMSKGVVEIAANAPAVDALRIMREKGFHHLPVTHKGRVVGILSESDLRRAVKVEHKNYLDEQPIVEAQLDTRLKAEELMSWPVVSVKLGADLVSVARRMIETRASCVVVLDEGHAKGILTHTDMLKALVALLKRPGEEETVVPSLEGKSLTEMAYSSPVRELFEALSNSGI